MRSSLLTRLIAIIVFFFGLLSLLFIKYLEDQVKVPIFFIMFFVMYGYWFTTVYEWICKRKSLHSKEQFQEKKKIL